MIKELYTNDSTNCDRAIITYKDDYEINPYEVEMIITFADYESARSFVKMSGFEPDKQIIKVNGFVNEIKVYENGDYIKSITIADFVDVLQNATKNEWIIITNGNEIEIQTGYRILAYKFN